MKKVISLMSLIVLSINCSQAIDKKIFLVGGNLDDTYPAIYDDMANSIGFQLHREVSCGSWNTTKCPKVAVVTSAADNTNAAESIVYPYYKKIFEDNGFVTAHINAQIDNYKTNTDINTEQGGYNAKIIEQADIIFFNGGNQTYHSRTWLKDDGSYNSLMNVLAQRYDEGALIVGTSAGMAVMGNMTFGGVDDSAKDSFGILYFNQSQGLAQKQVKDGELDGTSFADQRTNSNPQLVEIQHQENGGKMFGLNMLPYEVITDTHFGDRGRLGRLISAMRDTNKHIGLGVDQDNTALLISMTNNNHFKVSAFGKNGVYMVSTFDAAFEDSKSFTSAKNIRLDYLSDGDDAVFINNDISIIPSKNKKRIIVNIKDNIYSDDILSSYGVFDIISSLVKSNLKSAIGSTKIPKEYPVNTPVFEFLFTKAAKKSYCIMSNNSCLNNLDGYTIVNMRMDLIPRFN
ncbi:MULTISPECIES: cyanophycinase [Francisella]|uniref:cyanophycinase n=1 Tax=Francisella TaxID=262 RepID=UPI0011B4D090|nr:MULTISPECIES: cyanophycinase [Francisella]